MSTFVGNLFVVSAPSGAGKSSLLRALRERYPALQIAVSHTTRLPRPGEHNGLDYHFVDKQTFLEMVGNGEFLEHAQVFDHFYGTSELAVHAMLKQGHSLVLEIDWQGAKQVRKRFPQAICIFILPPSLQTLRERLTKRAQDNLEIIERRMQDAQEDLSHYAEYDYLIANQHFEQAVNELYAIVMAQELHIKRQGPRLASLLRELLS
ncbi:guanylate kinase [Achromatium sp. WMS3]|nr:guanylate kinase [Achromatium sp. WMS3]